MKYRNSIERRAFRKEFVYKYREELLVIEYNRQKRISKEGFSLKFTTDEQIFVQKMRTELGYSIRTIDFDIWHSQILLLKRLLNNINSKYE